MNGLQNIIVHSEMTVSHAASRSFEFAIIAEIFARLYL